MGIDEVGTARRLRERQAAISVTVREHGGRVVNVAGDGMLFDFTSIVSAVQCAVDLQRLMAHRNEGIVDDERMLLRIGVDVGDVIIEGDDVMGVGVNIAALEGIAEPGGVCVSGAVHDQSKGKVGFEFIDLGERRLTNIAAPIQVYAVSPEGDAAASASGLSSRPPEPPHLSIVVLPFITIGADSMPEYFADGVTESLTTDLSRIPDAVVIARNTAFTYKGKAVDVRQIGRELGVRYALEGSVQCAGTRLRINVQLVDSERGTHIWAERFDRDRGDLFEMQDEIITRLARALDTELVAADARRARHLDPAAWNTLDIALRGWAAFYRGHSPTNLREAEHFFDQALSRDPANVRALVGTAVVKFAYAASRAVDDRLAYLAAAEAAANKALALSPTDARAHAALAWIYMGSNRPALGIATAERSIALDRNFAPSHAAIGWAKILLGRADQIEQHIVRPLRFSPRDTFAYVWYQIAGEAKLALGRYHDAVVWLRRSIELNRAYPLALFNLAAALALQGRLDGRAL